MTPAVGCQGTHKRPHISGPVPCRSAEHHTALRSDPDTVESLVRRGSRHLIIMDSNLISALIGLGGVLVGALIAWTTGRSAQRRRNAVELFDTFGSADIEAVRYEAAQYLRSQLQSPATLSFYEMHTTGSTQQLLSVSRLLHFWERTFWLLEVGYADESLTRKLLEYYFISHYQTFLHGFARVCIERDDPPSYRRWTEAIVGLATRWNVSAPNDRHA
jgi:hypothetical protein